MHLMDIAVRVAATKNCYYGNISDKIDSSCTTSVLYDSCHELCVNRCHFASPPPYFHCRPFFNAIFQGRYRYRLTNHIHIFFLTVLYALRKWMNFLSVLNTCLRWNFNEWWRHSQACVVTADDRNQTTKELDDIAAKIVSWSQKQPYCRS